MALCHLLGGDKVIKLTSTDMYYRKLTVNRCFDVSDEGGEERSLPSNVIGSSLMNGLDH